MKNKIAAIVGGTALLGAIVFAAITLAPGAAQANPSMAKSTGQPCSKCHTAPPALNDYGKKYKDSLKK